MGKMKFFKPQEKNISKRKNGMGVAHRRMRAVSFGEIQKRISIAILLLL